MSGRQVSVFSGLYLHKHSGLVVSVVAQWRGQASARQAVAVESTFISMVAWWWESCGGVGARSGVGGVGGAGGVGGGLGVGGGVGSPSARASRLPVSGHSDSGRSGDGGGSGPSSVGNGSEIPSDVSEDASD